MMAPTIQVTAPTAAVITPAKNAVGEPSMSVKRKVTVPVGSPPIAATLTDGNLPAVVTFSTNLLLAHCAARRPAGEADPVLSPRDPLHRGKRLSLRGAW
jgi:hypothetical protein